MPRHVRVPFRQRPQVPKRDVLARAVRVADVAVAVQEAAAVKIEVGNVRVEARGAKLPGSYDVLVHVLVTFVASIVRVHKTASGIFFLVHVHISLSASAPASPRRAMCTGRIHLALQLPPAVARRVIRALDSKQVVHERHVHNIIRIHDFHARPHRNRGLTTPHTAGSCCTSRLLRRSRLVRPSTPRLGATRAGT